MPERPGQPGDRWDRWKDRGDTIRDRWSDRHNYWFKDRWWSDHRYRWHGYHWHYHHWRPADYWWRWATWGGIVGWLGWGSGSGIYYDYGSDRGVVTLSRQTYNRFWDDPAIFSIGVFTREGVDRGRLIATLRERIGEEEDVRWISNRDLREASLEIFDRTFAITDVLRLLAVVVAFIGVLTALMALQLERGREFGVLRANGLTPRQVWGLVTTQCGLMGWVSGLLALPLGTALAALLIHIINRRSFGWTLHMEVPPAILFQAVLLALAAALLAGIYPAYKLSGSSPALALREE